MRHCVGFVVVMLMVIQRNVYAQGDPCTEESCTGFCMSGQVPAGSNQIVTGGHCINKPNWPVPACHCIKKERCTEENCAQRCSTTYGERSRGSRCASETKCSCKLPCKPQECEQTCPLKNPTMPHGFCNAAEVCVCSSNCQEKLCAEHCATQGARYSMCSHDHCICSN